MRPRNAAVCCVDLLSLMGSFCTCMCCCWSIAILPIRSLCPNATVYMFYVLSHLCSVEFVQPVPDLVGAQHTGRQLLQSAGAGSYGGYGYGYGEYGYGSDGRRRLIMTESGGYGYGEYGYGEYGYGSNARRLSEELLQLEPSDPLLEYAEQQAAVQQAAEEQQQQGLSAAAASAIQHAHGKRSAWNVPAGQCYCRYDTDFNTWAVAEETCKQALYKRCKVRKCANDRNCVHAFTCARQQQTR